MFKFKRLQLPAMFLGYFQEIGEIHQHNTRSSQQKNYFLPRVETTKSSFSLKFQGPSIWNALPQEITELTSLKCFQPN